MYGEELLQDFVDEARTHIETIELSFLDKDALLHDQENINNVFRAAHSIKGTAGFFDLKNIVELSHGLESVLGKVREHHAVLTDQNMEALLVCVDKLKWMIDHVSDSADADITREMQLLEGLLEPADAADAPTEGTLQNAPIWTHLDAEKKSAIVKNIKRGHHLFEISFEYDQDTKNNYGSATDFLDGFRSFAEIIDLALDAQAGQSHDALCDRMEHSDEALRISLLITSVLEKELIRDAIEVNGKEILDVDINKIADLQSAPASAADEGMLCTHAPAPTQSTSSPKQGSIRVSLALLEKLMALSSEMVLTRNKLLSFFRDQPRPELQRTLKSVDMLTSKLQENIMLTRMQPIGSIFSKFSRQIRDISHKLGKDIVLELGGSEVELDRTMLEGLSDPISHIIRNAADHGIESTNERMAQGKKPTGRVSLNAYHKGETVVIEVRDDGRGLDLDAIKRSAEKKGIATKEHLASMTQSEITDLLVLPGFSTAREVTDISGRGVGLDVVKTNVEKMGGSIEIRSIPGEGTCISLFLPRTLAIIHSLTLRCNGRHFCLPQSCISQVINVKDARKTIDRVNGKSVLRVRDALLPVVKLADLLGYTSADITKAIVVDLGGETFCLLVDDVLDTQETLVMPLPKCLKQCVCYSGITIMGDGNLSLILDAEGIVRLSKISLTGDAAAEPRSKKSKNTIEEYQNMILFCCSGPETYALDMNLISRITKVAATEIEQIGKNTYISYQGSPLRVIFPEDFLPVTKEEYTQEQLHVIVPALVSYPIGIVFRQILDSAKAQLSIDNKTVSARGIFGTCVLDRKILLMLNIYELLEMADPKNYPAAKQAHNLGKKVLLAEDTPFFQNVERKYLESLGCDITLAQNGKIALDYLNQTQFDLLISDLMMPEMDGLELIKNVRSSSVFGRIPAIALSSMSSDYYIKTALESGFDAYECKLDKVTLVKTVEDVLRRFA